MISDNNSTHQLNTPDMLTDCNDSQNSQLKWFIYYENKFVANSYTVQTFLYQISLVIYKGKD